jgi:hypothetical protein
VRNKIEASWSPNHSGAKCVVCSEHAATESGEPVIGESVRCECAEIVHPNCARHGRCFACSACIECDDAEGVVEVCRGTVYPPSMRLSKVERTEYVCAACYMRRLGNVIDVSSWPFASPAARGRMVDHGAELLAHALVALRPHLSLLQRGAVDSILNGSEIAG